MVLITYCGYVAIVLCATISAIRGADLALTNGTTGTLVVERCVELITSSGIFQTDEQMIRRLAYVESGDGVNLTSAGLGGIWKISPTILGNLATQTYNASSFYSAIEAQFNISWATVTYGDLDVPLYSALAARLVLAHVETLSATTIPSTPAGQYNIWDFYFHNEASPITQAAFESIVTQLPTASCSSLYRDVIFAIDSSSTISSANFTQLKTFLKDVVDYFNVNAATTHMGIIQFTDMQNSPLNLSGGVNSITVKNAIDGMSQLNSGPVWTGFAISQSAVLFGSGFGGRAATDGVARVLVVVTHTPSDDNVTTTAANAASDNIGVIAIGVTNSVSQSELANIASGSSSTHTFQATGYSSLSEISIALKTRICVEPVATSSDTTINADLQAGESQTFRIVVPSTGKLLTLSTSSGTVTSYFSTQFETPTSVASDFMMIVGAPNTAMFHDYIPTPSLLDANNQVVLYCTVTCTSTTTASYSFVIGSPNVTTTTTTVSGSAVSAVAVELSGGEIAGIVLACLIFVCGIVIAVCYYWFSKRGAAIDVVAKESTFITRGFSRSETRIQTIEPVLVQEPKPIALAVSDQEIESDTNHYQSVTSVEDIPVVPPSAVTPEPSDSDSTISASNVTVNEVQKEDTVPNPDQTSLANVNNSNSREDAIRAQLRSAIENQDDVAAASAVNEFKSFGLVDNEGDLIRGERLIGLQECKQGLSYAMASRNIKILERAIFEAKQKNYQHDLKVDVKNSEILLQDLKKTQILTEKLNNALATGNLDLVESLKFELRATSGFDQATIDRMLSVHRCRENLERSMATRDLELAIDTLGIVERDGLGPDLRTEVKQAKKMKNELEYLEKVRQDVLNLNQSKVSEIRSYMNPPAGVHEVMKSVYVLFGYPLSELENWTNVQALMGKTGNEGLKRQILEIDPRKTDAERAKLAKSITLPYDVHAVQELSHGLSLFYVFVLSVIEEVEKINSGELVAPSPFFFALSAKQS